MGSDASEIKYRITIPTTRNIMAKCSTLICFKLRMFTAPPQDIGQ
jgi:hypothetical protein